MELAVLDLGSTTFHLQHFVMGSDAADMSGMADVDAGGAGPRSGGAELASALDVKKCTCLGAQVFADGFIDAHSQKEALAAVDELLELSDRRGFTDRMIVATSAIRSARNGHELAQQIQDRHVCPVRILEPNEEAWLAYAGQLGTASVADRRFAMIDLGGGSVEISVGQGDRLLYAESLPLGAVRVRASIAGAGRHGAFDAREFAALGAVLRERLQEPLRALSSFEPELYVFGSGSARAARKLLLRASAHPGKTGPVLTAEFRRELNALLGRGSDALIGLGVEPARSTTVLPSAAIMLQILELLGVVEAYVSDRGLRDGVAREMLRSFRRESRVYRRDFLADLASGQPRATAR